MTSVHHLRHPATGASASILPHVGFNLFDLRLPLHGTLSPIIAAAPDWHLNPEHPTRNGMPVLFPFPNRIRDAHYQWGGTTYTLEPNKPPHAIHGFAVDAPFDVIETGGNDFEHFVTGEFQLSRHTPQFADQWPGDPYLSLRYALRADHLRLDARIENRGRVDMPWGFGLHSYFWSAPHARVTIPAAAIWELSDCLPTGRILPVDKRLDFRAGKPVDAPLDDVLTSLESDNHTHQISCRIDSTVDIRLPPAFREIVLFTPPWFANALAIEPYTQATDAIHLQAQGLDAGLRVLPPGQSASLWIEFRAASAHAC